MSFSRFLELPPARLFIILSVFTLLTTCTESTSDNGNVESSSSASSRSLAVMTLESPDFEEGGMIPARFTCDGAEERPTLFISDVPADAETLAIIVEDPDVTNGTFVHWTAWNIDPDTTTISGSGTITGAVEGATGTGEPGYVGPCPPSGTHHYIFRLYAVSDTLNLSETADAEQLMTALEAVTLDEAELTGLYQRQ